MTHNQLMAVASSLGIVIIIIIGSFAYNSESGPPVEHKPSTFRERHNAHEVRMKMVMPGQTWQLCRDEDNPFEDTKCYRYEVLDVKNGYVKFNITYPDGVVIETNDTLHWFTVNEDKKILSDG